MLLLLIVAHLVPLFNGSKFETLNINESKPLYHCMPHLKQEEAYILELCCHNIVWVLLSEVKTLPSPLVPSSSSEGIQQAMER